MSATARAMVARNFARGGRTPWVSSARRTAGDAPVMNSLMPWRCALAATRLIALAAVESRDGTAAKSTTNALWVSAKRVQHRPHGRSRADEFDIGAKPEIAGCD